MLTIYWIWTSDPAFNRVPASLIFGPEFSTAVVRTLLGNYYALLGLWLHSYLHPSQRCFSLLNKSKFTPPESDYEYHQLSHKKHTFWRKNKSFQNNNPKAIGNFPFRSKRQSLQKNHIQIIWMFPKIVVPPKWMVYNGKPYVLMDDLGRKPPIFGNIHIDSQSAKSACLSRMSFVNWLCALSLLEPSSLPRFNSPATVEGVLRGKSCCWSCFLRVKKNVVDWFFG